MTKLPIIKSTEPTEPVPYPRERFAALTDANHREVLFEDWTLSLARRPHQFSGHVEELYEFGVAVQTTGPVANRRTNSMGELPEWTFFKKWAAAAFATYPFKNEPAGTRAVIARDQSNELRERGYLVRRVIPDPPDDANAPNELAQPNSRQNA